MSYSQLPPRLRTYIAASAVAAALAAGPSLRGHHVHDWTQFLGLLAVATLAGALKVELPIPYGRMSLGSVVTFDVVVPFQMIRVAHFTGFGICDVFRHV